MAKYKLYINEAGKQVYELDINIIITDIYKNGFAARLADSNEEDIIFSTPELTDDGKSIFKVGDKISIRVENTWRKHLT